MKSIKIEVYRESYLEEINNLILKDTNYIQKIENSQHVLLLLENETLIGVGSISNNFMHPYRKYISVYIDPGKRNNGLGMLLFNELNMRYDLNELQTALDSDNINAVKFVLKCGFNLARQCYCYDVQKDTLKPSKYNMSGQIMALNNLTEAQLKDVIGLQYEDYKINHKRINPLSENIRVFDWEKIIYDELVNENSYVLMKNNKIITYLFAYKIDETSIAIGYTGNRCKNIKEYENFLYEVMIKLFKLYKQIELEIDDCDISVNILGELFTYRPNLSWDTYIKDNKNKMGE